MQNVNKKIDKAQSEAAAIQDQGVKQYVDNRKVKMSLKQFLISSGAILLVGIIIGGWLF